MAPGGYHHVAGSRARRATAKGKGRRVSTQWLGGQRPRLESDFERISVYSDSANDLPLLERATSIRSRPTRRSELRAHRRAAAWLAHPETCFDQDRE